MSRRSKDARRLASLLEHDCGVWVMLRYDARKRRYFVHWMGEPTAPTEEQMFDLAVKHAAEVPKLDVLDLGWFKQEPVSRRKAG